VTLGGHEFSIQLPKPRVTIRLHVLSDRARFNSNDSRQTLLMPPHDRFWPQVIFNGMANFMEHRFKIRSRTTTDMISGLIAFG
jgi:hypothetical protein